MNNPMKNLEQLLKKLIGKKCSFNKYMNKLKRTLSLKLHKKKRIKLDKKGKKIILAAKWMDKELVGNLKTKSRLNRNWRYAKKNKFPREV